MSFELPVVYTRKMGNMAPLHFTYHRLELVWNLRPMLGASMCMALSFQRPLHGPVREHIAPTKSPASPWGAVVSCGMSMMSGANNKSAQASKLGMLHV